MPSVAPKFEIPVPIQGVHAELPITATPPDALSFSKNVIVRAFGNTAGKTGGAALVTRPGLISINLEGNTPFATVGSPVGAAFYTHGTLEPGFKITNAFRRLVFGCTKRWVGKSTNSLNGFYIITPPAGYTGGKADLWVLKPFDRSNTVYLLGVNGVNAPQKWDGMPANAATVLTGAPVAATLMILAGRVVLADIRSGGTQGSAMVTWSGANDMDTGYTAFANQVDTVGAIIASEEMGSLQGFHYKEDSIYAQIATAGIDPFRFELRVRNTPGPQTRRCVVAIPDGRHIYLARDWTIKVFDGNSVTVLGDSPLGNPFQAFARNFYGPSQPSIASAHGCYFPQRNEVWFFYGFDGLNPATPAVGVAISLKTGAIWPLEFAAYYAEGGITSAIFCPPPGVRNIVEQMMFGCGTPTVDENLFGIDTDEWGFTTKGFDLLSSGGAPTIQNDILALADTGLFDAGDPTAFKTLLETDHRLAEAPASPSNVGVSVLSAKYDNVPTVGTLAAFPTTAAGPWILGHRTSGRLLGLRLRHDRSTRGLVWRGATASFATRGRR